MTGSGSTAGFVHSALPTDGHRIRLVKFETTDPRELLSFALVEYKFSEKPRYNSLSYEWGDTVADQTILVNNCLFHIRANLHDFLKVLASSKYKGTFFFVDAICINQNDIPERNAQVQWMGQLYRQADNVLAWLGPGTAESDFIFSMCADAGLSTTMENSNNGPQGKTKDRIESIDFNESDGEALDTVYQRSYWTRLWVIQELFLAQELAIFCGSKSTTWTVFRRLPRSNKGIFVPGGFSGVDMVLGSTAAGRHARDVLRELDGLDKRRETGQANKSLLELVQQFGRAQCFDVRDRVYGLLGLASANNEKGRTPMIPADYSVTPVILFVRLLQIMPRELRLGDALDIFNILKLHHARESTVMPSVPDSTSTIDNHVFEVEYTYIGCLRHCPPTLDKRCAPLQLDEQQHQKLQGKAFLEIETGKAQRSMASHGGGPLYNLTPYDSCVTADSAREGDEVFLLEGTKVVLIRQQEETAQSVPSGSTTRYMRGVLSISENSESISKAAALLEACLSHLPDLENVCLRTDEHQIWSLMRPFEFVHEELTLQRIVWLLACTGRHNTYWDEPLVPEEAAHITDCI